MPVVRLDQNTRAIQTGGTYFATSQAEVAAAQSNSDVAMVVNTKPWAMSGDLSCTKPFRCDAGATITTTGYTLTLSGGFEAGSYQCFSGTGTVILPTTLTEAKAVWWGTTGAALQQAVNASAEAMVGLNIGGADVIWPLTETIDLPSHSHIFGSASIDASGLTDSGSKAMYASGSLSSSTSACDSDVSAGDYSVIVDDASGFAVDDWVLLHSDDTDVISAHSSRNRGEFKRIRTKVGDTVYFTTPVIETYTTSNSARLTGVLWAEDIVVDGPKLIGKDSESGNDHGIRLFLARDIRISNCIFNGFEFYSLSFEMCLNFEANSNSFDGVQYVSSSGLVFYGVAVFDCSTYGRVHHNFGQKLRHLVVTSSFGSGQGHFGQPYYISIDHNHMTDSMGGSTYDSFAYEHHGSGRFNVWDSNIADGCKYGFNIDNGRDIKVLNNVFLNCRVAGILFGDDFSTEFVNVEFRGNTIHKDNYVSGTATRGVEYDGPSTGVQWDNVSIEQNKITGFTSPSAIGIHLSANSDAKRACRIVGNVISTGQSGQDSDSSYGIYLINNVDWTIEGNFVSNMRQGIYSDCDVVAGHPNRIIGNTIEYDVQATAGNSIAIVGSKTIVKSNIVTRGRVPLSVSAGTSGALVTNNVWYNCVSAVSNSGTDTILRDNDTVTT